jgi:hypothetical protein
MQLVSRKRAMHCTAIGTAISTTASPHDARALSFVVWAVVAIAISGFCRTGQAEEKEHDDGYEKPPASKSGNA